MDICAVVKYLLILICSLGTSALRDLISWQRLMANVAAFENASGRN